MATKNLRVEIDIKLLKLWDIQKKFNDKFFATRGGWPKTLAEKTAATKDFALHLIKEVTEVFDELAWKMHRRQPQNVDRSNLLEELVDCLKFLFGLIQVWGFSFDDLEDEFKRKSMVVEQRFAQDQELPKLRSAPVVIVDIDGVLADYPRGFYSWVAAEILGDPDELDGTWYKNQSLETREVIKMKYRQSGAKANLSVLKGASHLLTELSICNVKIVLLTNRPYEKHYRIYPDTLEWLEKNKLPYDAIIWAKDKGLEAISNFKNILWAVDDDDSNLNRLAEAGITALKVTPHTRYDTSALVDISCATSILGTPKLWASKGGLVKWPKK